MDHDSYEDRVAALRGRLDAIQSAMAAETPATPTKGLAPAAFHRTASAPTFDQPEPVDLAALIDEERLDEVYEALAAGVDPNGDGLDPWTPLQTAAGLDNGPLCVALMAAGADPLRALKNDEYADGWTALHFASWKASATGEAAAALLAGGADPMARSSAGETPLHLAARNMCAPAARVLVEAARGRPGSRSELALDARNPQGETPLLVAVKAATAFAASESSATQAALVAQVLMEGGADANAKDNNGATALHIASRAAASFRAPAATADRSLSLAEMLVVAGADTNARDAEGSTPLHAAVRATPSFGASDAGARSAEMARLLLDSGAHINARDLSGSTPMHIALGAGCAQNVQLLAQRGAALTGMNGSGRTPLAEAIYQASVARVLGIDAVAPDSQEQQRAREFALDRLRSLHESAQLAQAVAGSTPKIIAPARGASAQSAPAALRPTGVAVSAPQVAHPFQPARGASRGLRL